MEQRRLRLGDILDDYCPRERRVTNHAVVAMIEDDVKQTRCTTCDAEHAYKGARVPKRRKKDPPTAAFPPPDTVVVPLEPEAEDVTMARGERDNVGDGEAGPSAKETVDEAVNETADAAPSPADNPVEDGPVHRPLIRATLPRPEGQKDTRPLPEFTIRQNGARGNAPFRGDRLKMRGAGGMSGNGNRAHGGSRFQGSRPGGGRGQGGRSGAQQGFKSGQPRHGGKKGRGSRG
jgi:hypothetical protein